MKAFILAAGYGTRLEPLTLAVPKPMVYVANLPIMQYNLELLLKHGIKEAFVNVHYHPEQIENYFGDGSSFGVRLSYSFEEQLLGTAGGVRKMAKEIAAVSETFLVFSSDVLTDINLGELLAYHKKKKALATIALTEVADFSRFGVVVRDEEGRITGFQEKPLPELALSRLANAGIYIFEPEVLEMIPKGFYDFGKELFPKLVDEKAAFYGYEMKGYWNDIGSIEKYMEANFDVLRGRVKIRVPGRVGAGAKIDPSARLEGTVIIGERGQVERDAYIKDSIIWSDTVIGRGSRVVNSIIGSFSHIGRGVSVSGRVIGNCKKLCLFLILFMLAGGSVFALDTQGARPMGMGGAFVGVADDVNSIFINPAGVGFLVKQSAIAGTRISNNMKHSLFAGVQPTFLGNFGLSYVLTDDPTAGSSTGSSYQTFSFTYAQEMNRVTRIPENMGHFSIGADVKACKYQSSAGFDFDIASVFRPDEKLSLGLCLRNSSNVDTLLLGASYKLLDGKLLCAVENSELGVEWQAAKGMMVRAGKMGSTYTYGFGLLVKGCSIDYACLLSASSPVYYLSASVI